MKSIKENIKEILALLWSISLISYLGYLLVSNHGNEIVRSEVMDIIKTVSILLLGFYFGSMHTSKEHNTDTKTIAVTETSTTEHTPGITP